MVKSVFFHQRHRGSVVAVRTWRETLRPVKDETARLSPLSVALAFLALLALPAEAETVLRALRPHAHALPLRGGGQAMAAAPAGGEPLVVEDASKMEDEFVHKVYDIIAPHFSSTRHSPWPKVAEFLIAQPDGSLVADVGCGNGKYMGINERLWMSGSDRSPELVKLCLEKGYEVLVADNLQLPYQSGSFDAAVSIAVVHHLSTDERRAAAVRELLRIVRVGGRVLVYVWAFEQKGRRAGFTEQDQLIPWHLNTKFKAEATGHGEVVQEKQSVVYKRYYHLFKEGELEGMCRDIGGCTVVESYYDHENWCVILEKDA